jgi:hypothetical protein
MARFRGAGKIWLPNLRQLSDDGDVPGDRAWLGPVKPHSGDDEFRADSLDSAWTSVVSGGTSVTLSVGGDVLSVVYANSNAVAGAVLLKPITISSGGYIETALRTIGTGSLICGLCFTSGTASGSTLVASSIDPSLTTNNFALRTGAINNVSGAAGVGSLKLGANPWIHLRTTWVSANTWRTEFSPDGVSWSAFGIADQSSTLTPTHMGFFYWTNGSGTNIASFDYFRCSG